MIYNASEKTKNRTHPNRKYHQQRFCNEKKYVAFTLQHDTILLRIKP